MGRTLEFSVLGRPVPKPRMTGKDKFIKRPVVERYCCYKTSVIDAYNTAFKKAITNGYFKFQTLAMSVEFYVAGDMDVMDNSNCLKAVEDALIGYPYPDDSMLYLRGLDRVWSYSLCDKCQDKKKCKNIKECVQQKTVVRLREIESHE